MHPCDLKDLIVMLTDPTQGDTNGKQRTNAAAAYSGDRDR